MRFFLLIVFMAALFLTMIYAEANAHGGGLNQEGCHNQRRTNTYHCHRKQYHDHQRYDDYQRSCHYHPKRDLRHCHH